MSELVGASADAEAGAAVPPQGHHCATPPWREQVPLLLKLWLKVPSPQMAVALPEF